MTSKLKQVAAKLKESLGTQVIYCHILGMKVKVCKVTTCKFYDTCHGFTKVQTQSSIQDS